MRITSPLEKDDDQDGLEHESEQHLFRVGNYIDEGCDIARHLHRHGLLVLVSVVHWCEGHKQDVEHDRYD